MIRVTCENYVFAEIAKSTKISHLLNSRPTYYVLYDHSLLKGAFSSKKYRFRKGLALPTLPWAFRRAPRFQAVPITICQATLLEGKRLPMCQKTLSIILLDIT
jgi:hypothetical protein